MGVLVDKTVEAYHYINDDLQDPRAKDIFYLSTPVFCLILDAFYIYFVRSLGPRLMKDRPAFQIDGLIKIYNFIQIVGNTYVFYTMVTVVIHERFNWQCMPIINDGTEYSDRIYNAGILSLLLKLVDLVDTVFFILRKKFVQASFLHVYHHAIMVFSMWLGMKYVPGGNPIFLIMLNSFVHVVMYGYYLLSSIDQEYKKSIWWKKHITQMQIVQFFLICVHMSQILFKNTCGYPTWLAFMIVTETGFMCLMFLDFYRKTYLKKKTT